MKFESMQGMKGRHGKEFTGSNRNHQGFTLVELITVIAIISLIVVYVTGRLSSSNEDAKVAIATTFFLGSVPAALSSYKARHMNSCADLENAENDEVVKALVARGLPENTPWQEPWKAAYNHDERLLHIVFPTQGMDDPESASLDILTSIWESPKINYVSTSATNSDPSNTGGQPTKVSSIPTESNAKSRAGSIEVWYDCI